MTENEEKNLLIKQERIKTRRTAACTLGTAGLILMLGSAGTEDYRDRVEDANKFAGAEVYSTDDIASPKTTNILLWGGALALAAAAGLALKNEKER